jgi:4-alpha-glucanotransferase
VGFHAWLQWLLDQQLDAAQRAATDAGMAIGVVHDLAVGVHPGGADAWLHQDLYAQGMRVGAPPDEFNQRGQDWGQPPWRPDRLVAAGYGPYRALLRTTLRHAGGLRLDHAMQVSRLWWVPEGGSPADGAYVRYDRAAMLAIMAEEARAAGAVIIGEDLGTVEPGFREDLAARDIFGTSLLWFERDEAGRPKPPGEWRPLSLATVGSHDMPPIRGFRHGDHIALRESLGLLTRPVAEERSEHERQLGEWLELLRAEGLLAADDDEAVVAALHAFLARTPARLIGVALTDAVGERRTQNQPGTSDEYPNWRIPLAGPDGVPLRLEDLADDPHVRAALAPLLAALRTG